MKLSFEVFPPKITDGVEHIYGCLDGLCKLDPEFISVTYSAGEAAKGLTAEVCGAIKYKYGVSAVSHLTCTGVTPDNIKDELGKLKDNDVDTILALRGDVTAGKSLGFYKHATELMKGIKETDDFHLFSACYPEGHGESGGFYENISVMKMKYDLGAEKFLSQLFFDNKSFLTMRDYAVKAGIKADLCAGIMPVLSANSAIRMVSLSCATLSAGIKEIIEKYRYDGVSLKKAGIDYAIGQIRDIVKEGVENIHLYTMDNAVVTKTIYDGIKDLI